MDCPMCEASHKEQFITGENIFLGPIGTETKGTNSLHKSLLGVSETT